jgi:phospholipid transport system substrate-binding protein
MLTRRYFLAAGAALAAFGFGPLQLGPARAWAQALSPQAAADFVRRTADELTSVVNGPGSPEQKQQRMRQIVDSAVDVPGVARFCLGRFWRVASPQQQQEYTQLFHQVLMNSITGKLGEYQGVKVQVGDARPGQGGIVVSSVVTRPGNAPNNVEWVIGAPNGSPKIEDVIAEGTSLRLTQRTDYASYLSRNNNNVQALIEALKRQIGNG